MREYNYNNELRHYGVLGMRLGVRKKRTTEDSPSSSGKSSEKSQHAQARKQAAKKIAAKTGKSIYTVAVYTLLDEVAFGGAVKRTIVRAGRSAVSAYMKRKGRTKYSLLVK